MGAERKTIRLCADVMPGFDPNSIAWMGPTTATHANPPPNSKRIWFDMEVPADHEIWPDHYTNGVNISSGVVTRPRRLIIDDTARDPRQPGDSAEVRRPIARRMARTTEMAVEAEDEY